MKLTEKILNYFATYPQRSSSDCLRSLNRNRLDESRPVWTQGSISGTIIYLYNQGRLIRYGEKPSYLYSVAYNDPEASTPPPEGDLRIALVKITGDGEEPMPEDGNAVWLRNELEMKKQEVEKLKEAVRQFWHKDSCLNCPIRKAMARLGDQRNFVNKWLNDYLRGETDG